jgi:hypothetical protein
VALNVAASLYSPAAVALPNSPDQAKAWKASGAHWSDAEIRDLYVRESRAIAADNRDWKRLGIPAEQRARAAYGIRHNERLTSRAMMGNFFATLLLRVRDFFKYGHCDGPTFEQLVAEARAQGLRGDAVYEHIVRTSEQTDDAVTKMVES